MTANSDPGQSRHSILFSAIEQAAAPTVELDELEPKIDESNQMAAGGPAPTAGNSPVTTVGGK
ncbi:MAG: hypothetical protein LBC63_05590 [Holophagales bacterium]|jgi:hypothetical protein|nr:hypothetical protein [Holophagales bacterium]